MMSNRLKTALRIALLFPIWTHCAEDYGTWRHFAKLRLDTSPTGAGTAGPVVGFPLLVRLTGTSFPFSQASGHGEDIRFSDAGGKPLPYQIERWDADAAAAEIWVRLDTVQGNAATQSIRMYWGKTDAADSSRGSAVFGAGNGYVAAWHLGGTGAHPNSVAGGEAAVPHGYTGNGSVTGMIGFADSLQGGAAGAYLDIGDGYAAFTGGFSFSAWIYSPVAGWYTHILDLGNGEAADNIVLQRFETTQTAAFDNYHGNTKSNSIHVEQGLVQNRWMHCAVTVQGKELKYYLDGALVASDTLSLPIDGVFRTENFLGKSNWPGDGYFQGILDEAELAGIDRNADWIKLSYANQKPDQKLITVQSWAECESRFAVASDTTLPEGSRLSLMGLAKCASQHSWSAIDGPAPRILDPEAETLLVFLPRVAKDTAIRYRFSAVFGDSVNAQSVLVRIRKTIPDPIFRLPPDILWNGRDPLTIQPVIENLPEILGSAAPVIHYRWTIGELQSEASILDSTFVWDALIKEGAIEIGLCLDNGGQSTCRAMRLVVNSAMGLAWKRAGTAKPASTQTTYNPMGRRVDPDQDQGRRGRSARTVHFTAALPTDAADPSRR